MARIVGFSIRCGKTINLGDSNSIRVEASVEIELNDGDDLDAEKAAAQEALSNLLSETYRAQRRQAPGEGQA